ncbi:MAG: copper resistance protein CopA [Psychromonas sp.]
MNIKKTKIALALTGALFLSLPISQAFAHEHHCEIEETQLSEIMKHMKSELKGYVKGVKSEDQEKMQKHLNSLLTLSEKATQYVPVVIENIDEMDHAKMDMSKMDHAKMDMSKMDHAKMDMSAMDHSQMDHSMMDMSSIDHDMSTMPTMKGMSAEQHHQHMLYIQSMEQLQDLFNVLNKSKDQEVIKTTLGKIKEHIKKSHKQFRQDC